MVRVTHRRIRSGAIRIELSEAISPMSSESIKINIRSLH